MRKASYYLILDRSEPTPRWVVAQECRTRPAEVPDNLDHPDGTMWLWGFDGHHFDWLRRIFGRDTALWMTPRGRECFATRIHDRGTIWTEYAVEVEPDRPTHGG